MEHSLTNSPLVSIVLGTQPEVIKLAPVIISFQKCSSIRTRTIFTGQHKDNIIEIMKLFQISPNKDLQLTSDNQTLTHVTSEILIGLKKDFLDHRPDLLLIQGDTTTAFASALAAFYERIPIGHIGAGVRTNNMFAPFPQEGNRCLISQITSLHFSYNIQSAANLRATGVLGEIHVTGNTIVDTLRLLASKSITCNINGLNWEKNRVILATVHGHENDNRELNDIANGLLKLLQYHEDLALLLPVYKNFNRQEQLKKILGRHPRAFLIEQLGYENLIAAIRNCTLIITDSEKIQEEASTFRKPILILKHTLEYVDAIEYDQVHLIGTNPENILRETSILLNNSKQYNTFLPPCNLFGDGEASERIVAASRVFLKC